MYKADKTFNKFEICHASQEYKNSWSFQPTLTEKHIWRKQKSYCNLKKTCVSYKTMQNYAKRTQKNLNMVIYSILQTNSLLKPNKHILTWVVFSSQWLQSKNNCKQCVLILGLQAKFAHALWGPSPSEKAADQSKILDLGSHKRLVTKWHVSKICFKKSLHPTVREPTWDVDFYFQLVPRCCHPRAAKHFLSKALPF